MKSQDILLLLKLVSLERQQSVPVGGEKAALGIPDDWRGWAMSAAQEDGGASGLAEDAFSVRGLEESTGISKSEVSQALRRCTEVGLVVAERGSG
ncbi:transcriptional regulator, partial [Xanthomonas oryzae pv. oryzae]